MMETRTLKWSSTNSDVKTEVNVISDYLKPNMPLPQYLPYARFLLDADLSHTSKLLYTLLLDRATLSQKNNWVDNQGRIYVIYPLSNLAKDLDCCISSVTRSFTELEKANLVERVRYGFSKPSHILLKVPHTVQNCAVAVCTSAQADCAETHSMIAQKCTPNQRNKNNLKESHLIRANNARLSLGEYQNVFLTEMEYKRLKADFAGLDGLIEQLSAYMQSTGRKYADHATTLRIWAKRQKSEQKQAPGIPDYTFKEGESLQRRLKKLWNSPFPLFPKTLRIIMARMACFIAASAKRPRKPSLPRVLS